MRNSACKIINGLAAAQATPALGAIGLLPIHRRRVFAPGQPLDVLLITFIDHAGRARPSCRSSSLPTGLRANSRTTRYHTWFETGYRLITEALMWPHLRLIIAAVDGRQCKCLPVGRDVPTTDLMDGVVADSLCQPIGLSGAQLISRRLPGRAIRPDPELNNGNYEKTRAIYIDRCRQLVAHEKIWPRAIQGLAPTRAAADKLYEERLVQSAQGDATTHCGLIEASWTM